jgi:hypothetical protein
MFYTPLAEPHYPFSRDRLIARFFAADEKVVRAVGLEPTLLAEAMR